MKISAFDRYDQQNDLRSIGALKIRAFFPRHVFSASRACARVSSEVQNERLRSVTVIFCPTDPLGHVVMKGK